MDEVKHGIYIFMDEYFDFFNDMKILLEELIEMIDL